MSEAPCAGGQAVEAEARGLLHFELRWEVIGEMPQTCYTPRAKGPVGGPVDKGSKQPRVKNIPTEPSTWGSSSPYSQPCFIVSDCSI